jgi:hypothetical protein
VSKGEELEISYLPQGLPVHTRRLWLFGQYRFLCECPACVRDGVVPESGMLQAHQAKNLPDDVGVPADFRKVVRDQKRDDDSKKLLSRVRPCEGDVGARLHEDVAHLLRRAVDGDVPFRIDVKASGMPGGGEGVWLSQGKLLAGTVICLYGGVAWADSTTPSSNGMPGESVSRHVLQEQEFRQLSTPSFVWMPPTQDPQERIEQDAFGRFWVGPKINHAGPPDVANVVLIPLDLVADGGSAPDDLPPLEDGEGELPDDLPPLEDSEDEFPTSETVPRHVIAVATTHADKDRPVPCGCVVALRDIAQGSELLADYGLNLSSREVATSSWFTPYCSPLFVQD